MAVITFTMDGRLVSASEEQTLLDVAREHGIRIPTLCHLDGLSEAGACRLCLVEVAGSSKLQPACIAKPIEGMEVTTHTTALAAYRRQIVELLLAERTHVCSVCVTNTHCDLQDLAVEFELHHVRYQRQAPLLPLDASHPRFVLDHNRCILCARCVRACGEIEGAATLDIMARGEHARVITDLNQPWAEATTCTGCGKCVHVCPTGALFEKGMRPTEERQDRRFIAYLKTAREKKLWISAAK